MKPFGVRLAAGAVTILLGAIMAAQAQKDHQDELNSAWDPSVKVTQANPTPIGTSASGQAVIEALVGGNETDPSVSTEPSPFANVADAIQLVQHVEDPATDPDPQMASPAPTFEVPDLQTALAIEHAPESEPAVEMDLPPTIAMTGGPAPQFELPPSQPPSQPLSEAPSQPSTAATRGVADQLPSNALRGGMTAPDLPESRVDPAIEAALRAQPESGLVNDAPMQMLRNVSPNSLAGDMPTRPLPAPTESRQPPTQPMADAHSRQPAMPPLPTLRENQALPGNAAMDNARPGMMAAGSMAHNAMGHNSMPPADSMRHPANQQQFNQTQTPAAPQLRNDFRDDYAAPAARVPSTQREVPNGFPGRMASAPLPADRPGAGRALPSASQLSGIGQPGDRRLEGAQTPSVVIHKRAPSEVKVGKPASFVIHVQNVGVTEALNVQVYDQIPAGMEFRSATPEPQSGQNGEYLWQLGNLAVGEERTVTLELVPRAEGELGSIARVTFEAAASVRTMSTRPEIKIVQRAPKTVRIGQQLEIEVEVSNPGTGEATGVILQEDVPEGLEHPKGRQLDNLIGTLRPGEVRRQILRLRAVAPGMVRNAIRLKADDGLVANHAVEVQVISPDLRVVLNGPSRRYLDRPANFTLDIVNAGTASANNVRIAAYLDRGFKFETTGNQGMYDSSRHAVLWELDELRPNSKGSIPLTLLPVQEGTRAIQLEAKADLGAVAKNEHPVVVEALAELAFSINDSSDPIEVGTDTTYEIRVTNSGSRPDTNVQVQLQFPQGIEVLSADGDAKQVGNNVIAFTPRQTLSANGEMVYRVKARGRAQGTHLVKAQVTSDQSRIAVTKEESTMVYDDKGPIAAQPVGFRR